MSRRRLVADEQPQAELLAVLGELGVELVDLPLERVVDAGLERFGAIDVLVNNAGGQFTAPAEEISDNGWRAVHRLAVDAAWSITRTVATRSGSGCRLWNSAGTTSPNTAISRTVVLWPARLRLNFWTLNLRPPANSAMPSTSRRLPSMDPVIEAFTRSISPARRATDAMISSARLPIVALRTPPIAGVVCSATLSVAAPITPESGTIASAASTKTTIGGELRSRATSAIGTKIRSAYRIFTSRDSEQVSE